MQNSNNEITLQKIYDLNKKLSVSIENLKNSGMLNTRTAAELVVEELYTVTLLQSTVINSLVDKLEVLNKDITVLKERLGL